MGKIETNVCCRFVLTLHVQDVNMFSWRAERFAGGTLCSDIAEGVMTEVYRRCMEIHPSTSDWDYSINIS